MRYKKLPKMSFNIPLNDCIFFSLRVFFSFLDHRQDFYQTWLYMWVTWRLSCKKQEQLTFVSTWVHLRSVGGSVLLTFLVFCVVLGTAYLREHLGSSPVCWWVRVAPLFSFLCCARNSLPSWAPGFISGLLVGLCCSPF